MPGNLRASRTPACAAFDLIEQLESQLSIFRETSEISHINRQAARDR